MSIARLHTWSAGEILLASDLNSEFNNITGNGSDLVSPFTKSISLGGFSLNFDAANTIAATGTTSGVVMTGGTIREPAEDTITAFATGGQTNATALSAARKFHRISTCATAADSVKLPTSTAGQAHYIRNDGAASCQVYGTSPDTINGIATGTGVALAAGTGGWFVCTTAAAWTTTLALPITGGTITGNLGVSGDVTISKADPILTLNGTSGVPFIKIQSIAGQPSAIDFLENSALKWRWTYAGDVNDDMVLGRGAGGTEVARFFQSTGAMALANLLDISGASAGQIQFPASQNASAGANVLDDYEEGTWTPSLGGSTTYTLQSGFYTKVGRFVYFHGQLTINSIGTGSTTNISGLPFNATTAVAVPVQTSSSTNIVSLTGLVASGATVIALRSRTAASQTDALNAIFANSTDTVFDGVYQV